MKKKKIYIRLIVTYLIVFLMPFMLSIWLMNGIADTTQDNICKSVQANLEHAKYIIDVHFQEIDSITEKLTANSTIRYIAGQMNMQDKNIQISKLQDAQRFMSGMQIQSFVDEYYLLFHDSDMIISPEHVYLDQNTLQYAFQYDNMEWSEWEKLMEESYTKYFFPEKIVKQNARSQEMILYVQSLVTYSGAKGNFIFPIKSEPIKTLMRDAYIANVGWAYVMDPTGKILLTVPSSEGEFEQIGQEALGEIGMIGEVQIEGRNVQVIQAISENTGLTFVAVLPETYITEQIRQARQTMFLLLLLVLAAGFLSIAAVSWYRGKKIVDILDILFKLDAPDWQQNGDEMTYISNSLKKLIERNEDLKDNILKQYPVTKGLLLESLLRGTGGVNQESLKEYGIDLENKKMAVLTFQFRGGRDVDEVEMNAKEASIYKQVLQKSLDEIGICEKYMCDTDISEGAFVYVLDEKDCQPKDMFIVRLNELCDTFWEEYGVLLRLAAGNVCESLADVSRSYDQACEMLRYGDNTDKKVFFYEDYLDSRDHYYFPVLLEERLVNAVRTGNLAVMHEQLREVYRVNVMQRNLSPSMMHFLVNDLQCAVFKALHGMDSSIEIGAGEIYEQLEQVNREDDILRRFNRINSIFLNLCEKVKEKNEASSHLQRQQIEAYIMENYGRNDMSLGLISEDFGYASTYFSKLFKELFSENFTTYLEKVRIGQVCALLKSGETLEKIAEKTGYNSVYVMRSAFKRIKGMTPNEFRKMEADGNAQ